VWHGQLYFKAGKGLFSCCSYRPVSVSCSLFKVLEYLLLPFVSLNVNLGICLLGFQKGFGCHHAHKVLSSLLVQASKGSGGLCICAPDFSDAFDAVVHAQALYSLVSNGINFSIIVLFFAPIFY